VDFNGRLSLSPPFTLQRLCELVVSPEKWGYTTTKRYVHAVEKVLSVTSYQDTLSPEQYSLALYEQFENMRVVQETKKPGEDELMLEEDMHGNPGRQSQSQEETSLPPHTDTPTLTSEEHMFSSSNNDTNSSAMDVDS
jgi:hypothetical protein